ncbi:MAG: HAD family phosphatase [Lachnospiraceae bacterium]|nr:HAD family phosphatase [Lachnospiraceae bacterium]MBP5564301.1 HAD family phosphatase [Lachnospiraceae bacterium]
MSDVKAVIFDMDGVIFDSERIIIELWEDFGEKNNMPHMHDVTIRCVGLNDKATEEVFKEVYGDDYDYRRFQKIISKQYHEMADGGKLPMMIGVREILDYLKDNGYKIALASSTRTEVVTNQLKAANIYEYFDKVVCGDTVTHSKPHPEIFLKAADQLGVDITKVYIIEDSFNGIRAAHAAKAMPIMVPDMIEPDDEMREKAFKILNSLLEVIEFLKTVN